MTTAALITDRRTLAVTRLDTPEPGPGEVTIDVAYCGLCGSDVHLLFDPPDPLTGHALGHELSGIVSAVADDVTDQSPGDRVVVRPVISCGECRACLHPEADGVCIAGLLSGPGLGSPGGLAGTIRVPSTAVYAVPSGLSLRDAALTEPLAVAMRAVAHAAVTAGDSVVVMGAGPIGLLTVEALHARGVTDILVIEPNSSRREQASTFGVSVGSPGDDVTSILQEAPQAVIDCSGHPSVAEQAIDLLGYGGRLVLVGMSSTASQMMLMTVSLKELIIIGSTAYSVRDFKEALSALAAGKINADALVTSVIGLDQAEAKINDLHDGVSKDIKILVKH